MKETIKYDREKLIRWVKENIRNFIVDMEWKQRHGGRFTYTEMILLNDYLKLTKEIEEWEKDV